MIECLELNDSSKLRTQYSWIVTHDFLGIPYSDANASGESKSANVLREPKVGKLTDNLPCWQRERERSGVSHRESAIFCGFGSGF